MGKAAVLADAGWAGAMFTVSWKGLTVLFCRQRVRGRRMEDIGYMVFGVAVAVLGIVLMYAYQHRSQERRKD